MSPAKRIRILALESSCDETAASVVEDGRYILSHIVASQAELHRQYGGVFPEMASRQHLRTFYPVVEQALREAHVSLGDIDALAVTRGPGLPGSLVVGVNFAKGLALATGLPLLGIHHLEAHIYATWIHFDPDTPPPPPEFPLVILIVSGGHTELIWMEGHFRYRRLGGTRDDAAGEAFDKVARLLGLEYPGGPAIERVAKEGNPEAFQFPRARLPGTWDFSFSGLKTAVMRTVQAWERMRQDPLPIADLAASFQEAVVDTLVDKTISAALEYGARGIVVTGGVSANKRLRERLKEVTPVPVYVPPLPLCTDNASMVAAAAYYRFLAGQRDPLDFDVLPTWPLQELSPPPEAERVSAALASTEENEPSSL